MTKHYDIVVIGAGGGSKISTPSSRLGYKVALLEKGPLGGTCLNRGCIPSKMLIHAADVATTIQQAPLYGLQPKGYDLDFTGLVTRVSKTIDEESQSINPGVQANPNIDWYRQAARFVGERRLRIGEEEITGERIFIAAGARPRIPAIPGLEGTPFLTSTEALRLTQQPKKLIVLGGGYIAAELAHFFGALGTEIHMIVRSCMLREEDAQVREEFERVFSQHHRVYFGATPQQVEYQNGIFRVRCSQQNSPDLILEGDQFLVAAGVIPNSDLLDLDKAGIALKKGGFIQVDDHLRTTAPNVWAFGDIAGNHLFRHSANFEGEYLFANVIHGESVAPIDYLGMPHAVFSHPQVAGVGEREEDLKARGANYVVGINPYSKSAMGMALRSDHGFVKMLVERETRKILGCHIVGHEASILIHEVIPLIRLGGKVDDLLYCIHIHPALSELVRNAARRARDQLIAAGEKLPVRLQIA